MSDSTSDSDFCIIPKHVPRYVICSYVIENADQCEGGGYLDWTKYVMCEDVVLLVIVALIWLALLFIAISVVADEFFSTNVSTIAAHLRLSESIAGATLLAFANGSPDVFGSIASVLSTESPKTGLALGFLLGGVLFVTLVVFAIIILVKPFKSTRRPILRDISFLFVAVGLVLFFFLYDDRLHVWEPALLLALYAIYLGTIIFGVVWNNRRAMIAAKEAERPPIPIIGIEEAPKTESETESSSGHGTEEDSDEEAHDVVLTRRNTIISGHEAREFRAAQGKISQVIAKKIDSVGEFFKSLLVYLQPFTRDEWHESKWYWRPLMILKAPPMIMMKATIPSTEYGWCKPAFLLQALTAPTFFVFAIQSRRLFCIIGASELDWVPFGGGPGFWIFPLGISIILVTILFFLTRSDIAPRWFRHASPYLGFVMSIAWIYAISDEVISVVSMLGVFSGISQEVLGLTLIAWSNCIGDICADIAVARQGYPRMAAAAAIGGPLFSEYFFIERDSSDLLIGFGVPFTVAAARDPSRSLPISFSTTSRLLIGFLMSSLLFSAVAIIAQRFRLRRIYSAALIFIYVLFLLLMILSETNVIKW